MLDHYIYQRSIKRERKRSTRVTVTNKTTLKLRNRAVFECLLLVYVRTYVYICQIIDDLFKFLQHISREY